MIWKPRLRVAQAALGLMIAVALVATACETPTPPSEPVNEEAPSMLVAGFSDTTLVYLTPLTEAAPAGSGLHTECSGRKGDVACSAGSSEEPLYVLDGVVVGKTTIEEIHEIYSIKKVEVIKGASAEALYGSRAANGLILIETAKGLTPTNRAKFGKEREH